MWLLGLFACQNGKAVLGVGELAEDGEEIIEYTLTITEPQYGSFYQDGPIPVSGIVEPAVDVVYVEGYQVSVNEDGSFSTEAIFTGNPDYEIVEVVVVEGNMGEGIRERIPVFSGNLPLDTWPGGMAGRLLPPGLDALGQQLGELIDASGWIEQIETQLPAVDQGSWGLTPVGMLSSPTVVALAPASSGVAIDFTLNDIGLEYELWWDSSAIGTGSTSIIIQIEQIGIGASADPILEDGNIILSLYESDITMTNPDFIFGGAQAQWLEDIIQGASQWLLEPIGENILNELMNQLGEMEIPGPFAFETDLMGTPLGLELDELYGDMDGLALELEIAVGDSLESNQSYVPIPMIEDAAPDAQLALVLHEAILDQILREQVLGLLAQDLDLSGFAGNMIGNIVMTLPGGDDAPDDAEGWCLNINPGTASVVRMQEMEQGAAPLAILYLPDMVVNIGVDTGSGCQDWLMMSLAGEVGITVENGSEIGIGLEIGEGAVLFYGAEDYQEDEVVDGFGRSLGSLINLLGGSFGLDLNEILGGIDTGMGLDNFSIAILDSQKIYDFYDEWPEGLYSISINLWQYSE